MNLLGLIIALSRSYHRRN